MNPVTLSRQQSRLVDQWAIQKYGFTPLVLMENAGRGVTDVLCRLGVDGPVVICCGKGNNAGDGFVVARHLEIRKIPARVLLWAPPEELTGDAAANFQILQHTKVPIEVFDSPPDATRLGRIFSTAGWIVDALLGTGARGEPRPPLGGVIETINAAAVPKLAIDLPSGLDCDTGQPARQTVRATHTCTFVALKTGFLAPGAEPFTGQIHVVGIGTPPSLLARLSDTAK